MPNIHPRASFIRMVTYWQEHSDFEKIEADKMMDTYFEAMKYYEKHFGKGDKTELFPEDIEYLLSLRSDKHLTIEELAEIHQAVQRSLYRKIYKLVIRGYVSSYKEKGKTYYRLTPYGQKKIIEEILK